MNNGIRLQRDSEKKRGGHGWRQSLLACKSCRYEALRVNRVKGKPIQTSGQFGRTLELLEIFGHFMTPI